MEEEEREYLKTLTPEELKKYYGDKLRASWKRDGIEIDSKASEEDEELIPVQTIGDLHRAWLGRKQAGVVPTGFPFIDDAIGGGLISPGLTGIVAPSGCGKTEFARHMRGRIARGGTGVVHIDFEIGAEYMHYREIAQAASIKSKDLRLACGEPDEKKAMLGVGKYENSVAPGLAMLEALPIKYLFPGFFTSPTVIIASVNRALRVLEEEGRPGRVVIIDSFHTFAAGMDAGDQRIAMTALLRELEAYSKQRNLAVVIIFEHNRLKFETKEPELDDQLRSIAEFRAEYALSTLFYLHKYDYDPETRQRVIKVSIAKTREGLAGWLDQKLAFEYPCWGLSEYKEPIVSDADRVLEAARDLYEEGKTITATAIQKRLQMRRAKVVEALHELVVRGLLVMTGDRNAREYSFPD